MHVTLVKKRFADGSTCNKCIQAEELLKRRELWERIDEVVWAVEGEPSSPGMQLASKFGIEVAPFFIVRDGAEERAYTSALEVIKQRLEPARAGEKAAVPAGPAVLDAAAVEALDRSFGKATPREIVDEVLGRYGESAVIAFSGAEDVALIDMAAKSGKRFSVMTLDTGRLHPETYRFIDKVRAHYGIEIRALFPDAVRV
jgi:hypothetical protein